MIKKLVMAVIALLAFVAVSAAADASPLKAQAAVGYQSNCTIYYGLHVDGSKISAHSQCTVVDNNPYYNGLQRVHILCVNGYTGAGTTVNGAWVLIGGTSHAYCPSGSHIYPGAVVIQRL